MLLSVALTLRQKNLRFFFAAGACSLLDCAPPVELAAQLDVPVITYACQVVSIAGLRDNGVGLGHVNC